MGGVLFIDAVYIAVITELLVGVCEWIVLCLGFCGFVFGVGGLG